MRVLLLGVGMQGVVALDDLVRSDDVTEVIAADLRVDALRRLVDEKGYGARVQCEPLDAGDRASLDRLFERSPDVAIDLLPPEYITSIAERAIRHGVPLLNTFFVPENLRTLSAAAAEKGVPILPELGMDPGIDLVLLGEAVRGMDEVHEIHSYGGGIPAPEAATNAIRYKVSWTLEGVLRAYHRESRIIQGGREIRIAADKLFAEEHTHRIVFRELGELEAYTNGDAIEYCEALGIDLSVLEATGRYSLRWPGHSDFWRKMVELHLLDDDPVMIGDRPVDRIAYLTAALEPHLQYQEGESDLAILRVVVKGRTDSVERTVTHDVIARRDPSTGFSAMGRLVGFTASIGARMLGSGEISGSGLLTPLRDVPVQRFLSELERRGVYVVTTET